MNHFHCYHVSDSASVTRELGGIYFFKIRFPNAYELGVSQSTDVDKVLKNINGTIKRYANALNHISCNGILFEDTISNKIDHVARKFNITMSNHGMFSEDDVENVRKEIKEGRLTIESFIGILELAFSCSPPLYIGIAFKQCLYDRLKQHEAGQSNLLKRLKDLGLKWSDLEFCCSPLENTSFISLRQTEVLLQNIFRPVLCSR